MSSGTERSCCQAFFAGFMCWYPKVFNQASRAAENDKIAAALTGVVQNALLSKSLGQDATPYRQ